jgi:hypothetical protein
MRGNELHVDETKRERQRPAALAKGGRAHVFRPQSANEQKAGTTAHAVKGSAPGPKAAQGGKAKMAAFTPAHPANAGRTGPR